MPQAAAPDTRIPLAGPDGDLHNQLSPLSHPGGRAAVFFGIPAETPFDLRFSLFGVRVRVHPMHWVISAVLGWDYCAKIGGNLLFYVALWVVCVFLSVLLHEMGHVLVGRLFGSDGHIVLFSFGGVAIGSSDLRKGWQRILVYFAGPAFQFVLFGLLYFSASPLIQRTPMDWRGPLAHAFRMLLLINWLWPIFNLFPIWPLDGGRICREVLEAPLGHKGVIASLWVSIIVSGALALLALAKSYGPRQEIIAYVSEYIPGGMWMAIFFALFCVASVQAFQYERSRNRWDDELPWER
jgi:stage IV sporulation protein FB